MNRFLILACQILNPKTWYFNLKYFPFQIAIKLPVFITSKTRLLKTNGKIIIEGPVKTGMIRIGFGHVGIFDNKRVRALWELEGTIHFSGEALFKFGSKITVGKDSLLKIGNGFRISPNSSIVCFHKISIGNNVRISWDTIMMDTDFHKVMTLEGEVINHPKQIIIGNNVWIGMRTTIMKGTVVQDNNIVGSNAFLNKSYDGTHCIIGGNPAKVIKQGITWTA